MLECELHDQRGGFHPPLFYVFFIFVFEVASMARLLAGGCAESGRYKHGLNNWSEAARGIAAIG